MLNKIQHQNKTQSKSPQFGHGKANQSQSKSPDYPKMGDYKRNQLIQHLNKIKHKNKDAQNQDKNQELSPIQQMELEVREFKKEIEKKYLLSSHNQQFKFPSEEQLSDDESLKDLLQVTVYNLKQQNNTSQKDLVRKTFDSDKKFEQDIFSKMQNLIQKTQIKDDNNQQLRIRTEGDDADLRLFNNLKTTKKVNYYKPQTKTQTLYDTIKQKKDKINIQSANNIILSKSQSPKYPQKTLNDSSYRQNTVFVGSAQKSPLSIARNQLRTEQKSSSKMQSFKSNNSRNQESGSILLAKLREKKPIKTETNGRGLHNYYFSMQNNSSLQLQKNLYSTTNANVRTQKQLHTNNINPSLIVTDNLVSDAKHSFRYTPTINTTMVQKQIENQISQSYRSRQQTYTSRNKNTTQNRKNNYSNESNHSDQSYKHRLAFQQDKLKELLKKSKPFYH